MNEKKEKKPINRENQSGTAPSLMFAAAMLVLLTGVLFFGQKTKQYPLVSYSEFLIALRDGYISEIYIIDSSQIRYRHNATGSYFETVIPYNDGTLMSRLSESGVRIFGVKTAAGLAARLLDLAPLALMIVFMFIVVRQNNAQNMRGAQFGRSRARLFKEEKEKVTFADVAGQEEAKKELAEIVDFLKNPKKYLDLGARIPTGILLVGSPGTGKTLLARAIAGEAGVSFLHTSGSDFVEMFVGVGASRVRDLFGQARKLKPAIVFIDEIDAVGRTRGAGLGGGHDEREQTLNQMLVEMDGFENADGVIILAATNRPDVLDKALLRPGRFDRQVNVSLPDIREREAILLVHTKKLPLAEEVNLATLARSTSGMSGADLANMANEAALFAAAKNESRISLADMEAARDKIIMGAARESLVIPEKERKMTAVHEAGHALQYYFLQHVSPLHKVTIIPRGAALGLTVSIPEEDSYSHTRSWFLDQLAVLYGGWAAETVVYGDTTTGAQNDIQRATEIARKMVCEWGMSDLGPVCFGQEEEHIFLGRDIERRKTLSDETARNIDAAIVSLLKSACDRALSILRDHREKLEHLANTLFERETLSDTEIRELLWQT
ncbi:MAG: ATP-dependent zinc metalloprotease FtsH [Spirochaetaceae bacterium]|nr:ATP-dependent zinc metalloprotease FtsH [Spirochaetaceae bacterium]